MLAVEEFRDEYPGEDQLVEFKSSTANIADPAVAFSNTDGGVILVGVNDEGLPSGFELTGAAEAEIHQKLRDGAVDLGRYTIEQVAVEGAPVVAIAVAQRHEGFSQSRSGRVLVRRGASNTALMGSDLTAFVSERRSTFFESTPTALRCDAVNPRKLDELAEAWGWTAEIDDRLHDSGLVDDDGLLTVAGVLLLVDQPEEQLGKAVVEVMRYNDDSDRYISRDTITGTASEQIERTVARIADVIGAELVVLGSRRHEVRRLPQEVVREAVANAVAHRSYELNRSKTIVRIRPSLVEINSPGGLPEPVTIENIREQTAARNPRLMDSLRRLGLAEDIGRGVDVIQDKMAEALLDPPEFVADGASVTVILRLTGPMTVEERAWVAEIETRESLHPDDRKLLVLAARGQVLTNSLVREFLSIDSTEARAALQRLRDADLLEQIGRRGGAQYNLSPGIRPTAALVADPLALANHVVGLAEENGRITNAMVRDATGLDRQQAVSLLRALVDEGRLEARGERRGSHYVIPTDRPLDLD